MLGKYCVGEFYTIKEVLEQFENSNDRVAVVVNSSDKVVGVISQGDILRALSAGIGMYKQVNQIIQSSFLHLYSRNMEEAYEIFKKKKITLLPVAMIMSCKVLSLWMIFLSIWRIRRLKRINLMFDTK